MIKIKPSKKAGDDPRQEAVTQSVKQQAKDAVHGGPKDPKKDRRMGVGRGQKG